MTNGDVPAFRALRDTPRRRRPRGAARTWALVGPDGVAYESRRPGSLGGHRGSRVYGRLDCPAAHRAIARGGYVAQRVFFATVEDARAAGYRPCGACLPEEHGRWKQEGEGMLPKPSSRVAAVDWERIAADLDADGCGLLEGLVTPQECLQLASLYDADAPFRKRVVMEQHRFGRGEYRYFRYPLPPLVAALRTGLYARLAPIANRWHEMLGATARFPTKHADYLARCHEAGQRRPTPLLLRYGPGDYNCLHQDLYGEHVFPIQVAVLLSAPGRDFSGGEFVLTEQRPRTQSRAEVVPLAQGDAVAFAVQHRPVQGARGAYRAQMRHGVSRVRSGRRFTLGIIFHDAK